MKNMLKSKKALTLIVVVVAILAVGIVALYNYRVANVAHNVRTHEDMRNELQEGNNSGQNNKGEVELSESDKVIISEAGNTNIPYDKVSKACISNSDNYRRIAVLVATVEYLNNKEVKDYKVPQVVIYKGDSPVPYVNSNGDTVKMTLLNYGARLTDKSSDGRPRVDIKDNKFVYNGTVGTSDALYIAPADINEVIKSGNFKSYELVDKRGKVIGVVFIEEGINLQ